MRNDWLLALVLSCSGSLYARCYDCCGTAEHFGDGEWQCMRCKRYWAS